MRSTIKHRLVSVEGDGFKYTNPGGFVLRGGEQHVLVRRNQSIDNMATGDATGSSIVLLKRTGPCSLIDTNIVILQAQKDPLAGYEDPRLIPVNISKTEKAFTYTYVKQENYYSCIKGLRAGKSSGFNKMMGPPISPCKNGFLFQTEDGGAIVVSRPDGEPIRFYRLKNVRQAIVAFSVDHPGEWWEKYLIAEIKVPKWARGEQGYKHSSPDDCPTWYDWCNCGGFSHIGFGTTISPRAAIVHLGHSNSQGKYYVTALQRLEADGSPVGPPEIIAEPASGKDLPVGDVPNVIYTTMAWIEGKELVMWSGHDDTYIIETRMRSPL